MELTGIAQIAIGTTGVINCIMGSGFLFFVKKGNLKANRILSILLLAVCFNFINEYRVEEFKILVNKEEYCKYKALAIAQECGFNSKSTFTLYLIKKQD